MVLIRRLVAAVIFMATLIAGWRFAAGNAGAVEIDLLVWVVPDVRQWLALLVAFAAGGLVAGTFGMLASARAGMVARRYRRAVAGLESEVHQLRNIPLASADAAASEGALGQAAEKVGTAV